MHSIPRAYGQNWPIVTILALRTGGRCPTAAHAVLAVFAVQVGLAVAAVSVSAQSEGVTDDGEEGQE